MSVTQALDPPAVRERWTSAQILVVVGSLVAPLNLLIVRSLTVYDVLIGIAFVLLLRDKALRRLPRGYLVAAYVFMLAATLSAFRATYSIEALTQILQYAFIFFVQLPVVISVVRTRRTAICVHRAGVRRDARRDRCTPSWLTAPKDPAGSWSSTARTRTGSVTPRRTWRRFSSCSGVPRDPWRRP